MAYFLYRYLKKKHESRVREREAVSAPQTSRVPTAHGPPIYDPPTRITPVNDFVTPRDEPEPAKEGGSSDVKSVLIRSLILMIALD